MIPKIIHYVWVGNNPKSDLVLKCIESWKKYCPDYYIMEWGNDALKKIDNLYMNQAVEHKKWAFVSDYVRLYALYQYGGIYCDTDLEITQNIDIFLTNDFFMGYELCHNTSGYQTAFIGAKKENPIIKDLLDIYQNISFFHHDQLDMTPNPKRFESYFKKKFKIKKINPSQTLKLTEKQIIYPYYYFCVPVSQKENYSIHHFNGSWLEPYSRKKKFAFKKYTLICVKKRNLDRSPFSEKDKKFPLKSNEKIIWTFKRGSRKKLYLIKKID